MPATAGSMVDDPPPRVLIVEDELLIADELRQRLQDAGFDVVAVERSGESAVRRAHQSALDVVLMDIRLAGPMDGVTAAGLIEAEHLAPVVMLTAHSDRDTVRRAQRGRPHGYLVKPIDGRALEPALRVAIERFGLERRVRDSERRFRGLADMAPLGIFLTDAGGLCTFTNACWQRLAGLAPEEALGRGWERALHPDDAGRVHDWWYRAAVENRPLEPVEFRFRRPDGSVRWVRVNGSCIRDDRGAISAWIGTNEDVTTDRQQSETVARFHAQIRALARRVETAREEERAEVARVLHEGIAQELTALRLGLARIGRLDPSELDAALANLDGIAASSLQSIREFTAEMHPHGLLNMGLAGALRAHLIRYRKRYPIAVEFDGDPLLPDLTLPQLLALYRAGQEALTNVAKHSGASKARLSVRFDGDSGRVVLTVEDDGRGIADGDRKPESLGLVAVSERLEHCHGKLAVTRGAASGTRFVADIPV